MCVSVCCVCVGCVCVILTESLGSLSIGAPLILFFVYTLPGDAGLMFTTYMYIVNISLVPLSWDGVAHEFLQAL